MDKEQADLSQIQQYKHVYVYAIREQKVIFIRKKGKNTWELPGGKIEPGETLEDTAKREFLEETGYEIEIVQSVETGEEGKIAFVCKLGNRIRGYDQDEIKEIKFFNCVRIPQRDKLSYGTDYGKVLSEVDRYLKKK